MVRSRAARAAYAASIALATAGAACSKQAERVEATAAPATGPAGYCRTTTCTPPVGYPSGDLCEPPGWADECSTRPNDPRSDAPLWWRSACVGYDLQKGASRRVDYDDAAAAVHAAFSAWTSVTCPSASGSSRVGIDAHDLGPVACASRGYDKEGPNQNLIVFQDDVWPHEAQDRKDQGSKVSFTIALTTVTFDTQTGEIFDADLEINSADWKVVPTDTPDNTTTFDLRAVLVHEVGHFFGLAHSPRTSSVMYSTAQNEGQGGKLSPSAEDVAGICSIYPAGGTVRTVSSLVDPSGTVASSACDPTPRHGFTGECVPDRGCAVASRAMGTHADGTLGALACATAIALARRRAKAGRTSRGPSAKS